MPSSLKIVASRAQARAWLPGVGIGWPASELKVAERRPCIPPPIAMNS